LDSQPPSRTSSTFLHSIVEYLDIILGFIFSILAIYFHGIGYRDLSVISTAIAIGAFSMTVAEIADILAERFEEPYASFVLTFSAVVVEIVLLFMIIMHATGAEQGMDTVKGGIISAVIVDLNVLLGIAVFIGGLKFKEQEHNEDTSSTYTTILLVATSALLVPSILNYTENAQKLFQASVVIATILMIFYIFIFIFQTRTHNDFFKASAKQRMFKLKKKHHEHEHQEEEDYIFDKLPNWVNLLVIFVLIFAIGFLAEIFAKDGMVLAKNYGVSAGLAGLIIAIIAVSPEIMTAIKAAKEDEIQRVVNIAMGASTVSIMLTVPMLMLLSYFNGINLTLDFNAFQVGALLLTIILAWKTTDNGETNYFEGISHLMFFAAYATIATLYN
jgi:Ca2+:H+ antiporter